MAKAPLQLIKSLKFNYLFSSIFILHIAFALSYETSCKGEMLYGYGKLYYNNTAHKKEGVCPLTLKNKYKSTFPLIKKDLASYYNNKPFMDLNIQDSH